jgi:alpha-ribazole phosphatase
MQPSSNPETALWLIRHPEPEASTRGQCYGSLDVELSDDGVRHAHRVADALAGERLDAIYSSPLQRCRQAAEILAAHHTGSGALLIETMDALKEMHFGEFEGRTYEEIAARYPDLYQQWMQNPTGVRFPGGESFSEMQVRVLDATNSLRGRHAGHSIALVTHAGVIRIILADALRMDPGDIFRIGQRYGAINFIRYFGENPLVELVNAAPFRIE